MSLYSAIGDAWKEAMKQKDPRKDVLALIRSEVKSRVINARTEGGGAIDPSDDVVLETLQKMAKQRRESITEYQKGGRNDLVEQETFELNVIEAYLPQKMSMEQLHDIVRTTIAEVGATSAKEMGKVMAALMPKVKGQADGKDVQTAVKALLG